MDKRFDRRTKEEFKKDIRKGAKEQSIIINSWLLSVDKDGNRELLVKDNGIDNSGNFINSPHRVTCDPDYYVEGYGLIEVQYSNTWCKKYFHIKRNKILACIRQDAIILMVNGWGDDHPKCTLITPGQCRVIAARLDLVNWFGGGNKESYRVPLKYFDWKELPKNE